MRKLSRDQLIELIADTIGQWDTETIVNFYNNFVSDKNQAESYPNGVITIMPKGDSERVQ